MLSHYPNVTEWIPDIPSSLRSKVNSGMTKMSCLVLSTFNPLGTIALKVVIPEAS